VRPIRGQDFAKRLGTGPPAGCYAFCGPEIFLREEALDTMRRSLSGQAGAEPGRYLVDTYQAGAVSASEIATLVSQTGLFGAERLVLIENIEKLTRKKKTEKDAWKELARARPANPLILISSQSSRDLSRRSTFLAALLKEVQVVEFWHLFPRDAARWARQRAAQVGLDLHPRAAAYLVDHVGTDLHLLLQEIEKISLAHDEAKVSLKGLRQLVSEGILGSSWECVNALLEANLPEALERLQGVRREETAFSFLWKLTYSIGLAMEGKRGRAGTGVAGVQRPSSQSAPYERVGDPTHRTLAELLVACYRCEHRLKGGRWSSGHEYVALEGLLVAHWLLFRRLGGRSA
jgi:DNA polymerase III delta subunit